MQKRLRVRGRWLGIALVVGLGAGVLGVPAASASPTPPSSDQAVISAMSTTSYGTVLEVGGTGPLAGAPLYDITSDSFGHFGCTTAPETTFQGTITCTGPESDAINGVETDEWPALTTTGRPIAGPGVRQWLLGSVYRPGVGRQVTYAGHPLYLFDPPSSPFTPFGANFYETVLPLPPWHGLWNLVSASNGEQAPGPATVETETLPSGATALAAETYQNVGIPGGVAVTAYALSGGFFGPYGCLLGCGKTWIPLLTDGAPSAVGGANSASLGTIWIPGVGDQVTYHGKPLY